MWTLFTTRPFHWFELVFLVNKILSNGDIFQANVGFQPYSYNYYARLLLVANCPKHEQEY